MDDQGTPPPGTLAGFDLTVDNADEVRDFYAAVVGWTPEPYDHGDYADWFMHAPDGSVVAGVCHARGENAGLPAQWLAYVVVGDLDASIARCEDLGGAVVAGPRGDAPAMRYCVIRDPAGAVIALMEPGTA